LSCISESQTNFVCVLVWTCISNYCMVMCLDWLPSNSTLWYMCVNILGGSLESKKEPSLSGTWSSQKKMPYQPNGLTYRGGTWSSQKKCHTNQTAWLIVRDTFVLRMVTVHYIKWGKPRNGPDWRNPPPPTPPFMPAKRHGIHPSTSYKWRAQG
jgi:hypothetical protein